MKLVLLMLEHQSAPVIKSLEDLKTSNGVHLSEFNEGLVFKTVEWCQHCAVPGAEIKLYCSTNTHRTKQQ